MAADGSIIFDTKIDDEQAQKDLNMLTKKIDALNDKIASKKQERMPLVEQAKKLGVELDAAKSTLDHMQSGTEFFPTATIDAQATKVKALQKEWDTAQTNVEKVDASINKMTGDLNRSQEKAGALSARLVGAGDGTNYMAAAVDRADKYMNRFVTRVKGLARRVFVFTLITMALRSMRDWFGKIIKTNSEATAAIAKLKGALLTLAQPLVNVIIPAFTAVVNVLARIITSIAKVISLLFGSTIDKSAESAESLYNEQKAIEGVGSAAKKAGKSMAAFDEINQISGDKSASAGGGSSSDAIKPDFDFDTTGADGLLSIVRAIGEALLAWRISSALELGLKGFLGLLIAIHSALDFVKNLFDAWVNGVSWENLLGLLTNAAILAGGLWLALGKTAAAISLVVTGIAMLSTGFHDMIENGMNWENTLLSIAGIMTAGIGISLLTKSWIPALIAGLASGLLALTMWAGNGAELVEGLKKVFQGFSNLIKALVSGDVAAAGEAFKLIWEGVKISVAAVCESIKIGFAALGTWLLEILDGYLASFLEWAEGVKQKRQELFESLKQGVSDWWNGIISDIKGAWGAVSTWWKTNVAKYFTANYWSELGRKAINGLIGAFESGLNKLISGINRFIDSFNERFEVVRILTGFPPAVPAIPLVNLPRLAQGAVIPPNREFMAVLGDQKSGTNIETPLATMVQAFKTALAESGYSGSNEAYLMLDRDVLGKVVYKLNKSESNRIGVNLAEV